MKNLHNKIENRQRKYSFLLKEALIEALSGYLDTLITVGIIKYSIVKKDFGMDYDTIRQVQVKDSKVSAATIKRLVWIIAFYLNEYRGKVNAEPNSMEKTCKLKAIPALEKEFERIFGHVGTYALSLSHEGVDLRQLVKEK